MPMKLTEIEKLGAAHPDLMPSVRGWLELGVPSIKICRNLNRLFAVNLKDSVVERYRTERWVPEKEVVALKMATTKAAIEAFGGDVGLDALLLAKLWELMDKMTVTQLLTARALFVRVRAQNLKEQEFLYKTGQLKPAPPPGQEIDREKQSRDALRRIKEIFGLAGDAPPKPPVRQPPAAAGKENA